METFLVELPVIAGTGGAQALIVTEIPLSPPAFRVERAEHEVAVDRCAVAADKVTVYGRLIKQITYKTRRRGRGKAGAARQVGGAVAHCSAEIPFHLAVPVAGAREGDTAAVIRSAVETAHEELADPTDDGTFRLLKERSVVRVRVRAVRNTVLRLNGDQVGEQAGQEAGLQP